MPNLPADNAAANAQQAHPAEQNSALKMADQSLPKSPLAVIDRPTREPTGRPIVAAIGASAGGLEAIRAFFEALPADPGIAFVVIMHLAPDYPSELPSLISTRTAMAVSQVTEAVEIERNHIYVIPPNRRLLVNDNTLSTQPFAEPRGQRAPIDLFFRSLAEMHGDGFALIFSGSGSDGAVGLKNIKERGGLVLVQEPSEADFDGMPRSAIATGLADLVLPVRELAARMPELIRSKRHLQAMIANEQAATLAEDDELMLRRILSQLQARTGNDFSQYKRSTLLRRIGRRMQVNRTEKLADYLTLLREKGTEAEALFDDLLISVTTFFRDPDAFEALRSQVLEKLIAEQQPDIPLRIWVAGCATGEEAYSLACLLIEEASRRDLRPHFQIFATDLAEGALAVAREGRYAAAIEADVSPERLHRFFTKEGDHYRINKEVRDTVLFATHNLLKDPPFSRLDLISCRNLLIYLDRALQEQIFGIFYYALRHNAKGRGYLFLGSSESATEELFRTLDKKQRIFQLRERTREEFPLLPELLLAPPTMQNATLHSRPRPAREGVANTHRQLLETLAPPSVLVDEAHNAIHLSETAGRYLQHPGGTLTRNIVELVRPELQIELRAALYRAFEQGARSLSNPIPVRFNGTAHGVIIVVQPRQRPMQPEQAEEEKLALVTFLEGASLIPENSARTLATGTLDTQTNTALVQQLQSELHLSQSRLSSVREEYEAANEELRAANEELQSINEEYRSTGEELETSKEELQSINEELQTVNAELKNKLDEISHAHSDLQNFMAATEGGTLFLDRELRINRFTRPVTDLINVKISDRGRPITDFTHRLNYATLECDAQRVLDELTTVEREVESSEGRAFLIRLRPYRTVDNHINGVVVTFVDVTDRRQAQQQVRRERDYAQHIIDTVREGLVVLTPELRLLSASNAFYRHFQMQQAEIEGRLLYELGNGQWDLPELRTLLEEVLPQNRVFEDYVVNATFDGIGERTMLLNARRIDDMQRILLAIEDITDRPVIDASLRAAERRYRALAEATSDALYRLNADATTVVEADLANGHAPVAAPDLPLSWLQEQVHPDDQAAAQAAWRKARNSQAPFAIEHRLKDADGNWRWLFARAVPVRDETGTVIEWIGAATDITAHKADEEGWQIAGEGFHHALQHSPVVFARVDTDLRYQWLFHPHADFDIKEALGKRDDELSSAPGIAELIHLKEQTLALGEQQRAEITFLLSDGYHIYDVTATPIFNAAGEATGLLTAGFDVTAHKAAEAALQASKERYQALFAAIDEAFVLCESVPDATGQPIDYRLIEANPAFAKMTGVSPAAVQGRTVRELLPDTGEWWVESCRRVALRGEAERIEKQITAQGRWYTIYLFACGAGQVALLFSDISERRQNEQTLRHFNERLETRVAERTAQLRALAAALTVAEQAERQRLARVLHDDLQQLLYALRMRATLCIESATAAGMAELSASIQEIYDWLGDSITLTRQLTVDLSPPILEQKGLVEALQWLVAHVAERYGLQVALQTPAAVPVVEEEMRVLIFQTVSELLFNIFKHAGTKEATITVQTETVQPDREQQLEATVAESTPSEQLVIRVSDSGRGFDLATFEANDHQGFGLYHVRERLKFFGGRLEIATAPGAGTRLTIYAPVAN